MGRDRGREEEEEIGEGRMGKRRGEEGWGRERGREEGEEKGEVEG